MTHKKFIRTFFILLGIFILFHLVIWNIYTTRIFNLPKNYYVGDLGRTSYQIDLLTKRKIEYTLPIKHFNKINYTNQKIDIITIGDSFSNGAAGGLNPYYQDFIATKYKKNVLNIKNIDSKSYIDTIIGLFNKGTISELKPEAIIIETVQRSVIKFNNKKSDFKYIASVQNISQLLKNGIFVNPIPKLLPINIINIKILFYMLQSFFKENYAHNVYKFTLNQDLFSSKSKNKLIIYKDDIKNINDFSNVNIIKLNNKLNNLALLLKTINVKLYFMPAVDKYDLYYNYIQKNIYQKNPFFKTLDKLDKEYYFVNTKQILLPLLADDIQDVFYSDDTHWSSKASEAIVNSDIFKKTINVD